MKEKDDKLKLMKQILINDDKTDTVEKLQSKETIQIPSDSEMPATSKIPTTPTAVVSETVFFTPSATTPKTTTKTTSAIKFEDSSDSRLSRKVSMIFLTYNELLV